jgi:hypothetical protein
MASPTTLRLVHPDIDFARKPRPTESRIRRLFRRRARHRRVAVGGWREEATFRGMTRMGA